MIFLSLLLVDLNAATLSWAIGPVTYFIIGSLFEERKLRENLEDYDQYKLYVGWFFPYKKIHFNFIRDNFRVFS